MSKYIIHTEDHNYGWIARFDSYDGPDSGKWGVIGRGEGEVESIVSLFENVEDELKDYSEEEILMSRLASRGYLDNHGLDR